MGLSDCVGRLCLGCLALRFSSLLLLAIIDIISAAALIFAAFTHTYESLVLLSIWYGFFYGEHGILNTI